jgi:hypothetical protein
VADAQPRIGGDLAKKSFGTVQQHAATVAGLAVGADGAPMRHAGERSQRGIDHPARGLVVEVGDQPETAAVAFLARVVETGLRIVRHRRLLSPDSN